MLYEARHLEHHATLVAMSIHDLLARIVSQVHNFRQERSRHRRHLDYKMFKSFIEDEGTVNEIHLGN